MSVCIVFLLVIATLLLYGCCVDVRCAMPFVDTDRSFPPLRLPSLASSTDRHAGAAVGTNVADRTATRRLCIGVSDVMEAVISVGLLLPLFLLLPPLFYIIMTMPCTFNHYHW